MLPHCNPLGDGTMLVEFVAYCPSSTLSTPQPTLNCIYLHLERCMICASPTHTVPHTPSDHVLRYHVDPTPLAFTLQNDTGFNPDDRIKARMKSILALHFVEELAGGCHRASGAMMSRTLGRDRRYSGERKGNACSIVLDRAIE